MQYKIAFFLPNLENHGGVTVSVQTIANYLKVIGHDVHLFPVGKTTIKPTPTIHPINSSRKTKQIDIAKALYTKEANKKPFDLTVSNHFASNKILHYLPTGNKHLIILRQPSLLKTNNFLSAIKKRVLYPKIYNHKNIVAISRCLLDSFLETYNYIQPKTSRVIYNAFDPTLLQKKASQTIELPTKNPYIINVGRFTKTKNQADLIKAFNQIKTKNIDLVLLGDGKERQTLQKIVKKFNLEKRVHFIKWVDNPFPYIKRAKLLVHTARSETFGRVILEALALQTPVVATNIKCGPNEILTGNLAKFLVPLDNISLLVNKIEKALESYPKITPSHLEPFHIEHLANLYLNFIQKAGENV